MDFLENALFAFYVAITFVLLIYGLNAYVLVGLFIRRNGGINEGKESEGGRENEFSEKEGREFLPAVTTQVPLYNEMNVAGRVIRAVVEIDYPKELHEIQILDDSTDETQGVVDELVSFFQGEGYNISVVRRKGREGFKAGALAYGLKICSGEYVAIFDSDFVPKRDFLKRALQPFHGDGNVGMVQGRWTHLNAGDSFLTRSQALGIDGHFIVEQTARSYHELFMNFNGTAGVWRREAIEDSGGWQHDTLTEDMDLSYRAQIKGWKMVYLKNLEVPAELPSSFHDLKSQQFRWAKGSIQTAIKVFPEVVKSSPSLMKCIQAWFHLTHYLIHPLIVLLVILSVPILFFLQMNLFVWVAVFLNLIILTAALGPSVLYTASQVHLYPKQWLGKLKYVPLLTCIGIGIAISNSRAVFEALFGIDSAFVRTPKQGDGDCKLKHYRVNSPVTPVMELVMGGYAVTAFWVFYIQEHYLALPVLMLYSVAFLLVGSFSLKELRGSLGELRQKV